MDSVMFKSTIKGKKAYPPWIERMTNSTQKDIKESFNVFNTISKIVDNILKILI